jgi:hypothetical protein
MKRRKEERKEKKGRARNGKLNLSVVPFLLLSLLWS